MIMDTPLNICFVSIGANGSAIAADMIAAGVDMSCYDPWPSHVETIQKDGLNIQLPDETKTQELPIYHLCELAERAEPFDIIFMASKSYDTKWITELIKPHLAEDGMLVSLQNGMTTDDICQIISEERVLSCVVELSCELFTPGQIKRNTPNKKTWFAIEHKNNRYLPIIFEMLKHAGTVVKVDDIQSAKWMKLLVNSMSLGPFAILGRPVQEGLNTTGMRELILKIGEETQKIGDMLGFTPYPIMGLSEREVNTANDLPALLMDTLAGHIGPSAQDCILQDFVRGRRTEIETINGFIVEKAKEAGIEAPYNQAIIEMGQKIKQKELDLGLDNVEHLAALMSK
jgi:2-dehydropantoate 2-reductase